MYILHLALIKRIVFGAFFHPSTAPVLSRIFVLFQFYFIFDHTFKNPVTAGYGSATWQIRSNDYARWLLMGLPRGLFLNEWAIMLVFT